MIHAAKGFSVVNEAEIDVFSGICFLLYDPTIIAIFDSSAFSKPSLSHLEVLSSHTAEA